MKLSLIFILLLSIFYNVHCQLLSVPFIITDGTSTGLDTLKFGVDPNATDGIDTALGEYQLPPTPPTGIFDCRFIGTDMIPPLPLGQGIKRDYRQGSNTFVGMKLHELSFQRGTGNSITIIWNLPNKVTGRLFDLYGGIVVNDSIFGTGSINITNNAINKLFMRINYASGWFGIKKIYGSISQDFLLSQNYPNPFNPVTNINFDIVSKGYVKLNIIDVLGHEVAKIVNQELQAGSYKVEWDGSNFSSGVYFYRLEAGSFIESKKMIFIK